MEETRMKKLIVCALVMVLALSLNIPGKLAA